MRLFSTSTSAVIAKSALANWRRPIAAVTPAASTTSAETSVVPSTSPARAETAYASSTSTQAAARIAIAAAAGPDR